MCENMSDVNNTAPIIHARKRTNLDEAVFLGISYKISATLILFYRKIHCLASEFRVKFHAKNRYRTNREAMSKTKRFLFYFMSRASAHI